MDYALTSLDMFSGISENLINYAFNVSFLTVFLFLPIWIWIEIFRWRRMRWIKSCKFCRFTLGCILILIYFRNRLTLATIIFLPLTLLTGYFVRFLSIFTHSPPLPFELTWFDPGNELWPILERERKLGHLVRLSLFHLLPPLLISNPSFRSPQLLEDRSAYYGCPRPDIHVWRYQNGVSLSTEEEECAKSC